MAYFSYNKVKQGIGEAQSVHKWLIRIPKPAQVAGALPEELQIRATSTSKPSGGDSLDFGIKLHNHTINYNGGVELSGEWSFTLVEGTDMKVQAYFNKWINARFESGGGDVTGKSTDTANLKADIYIDMLAPDDSVTATYEMVGAYVKPDESLELGQDPGAMNMTYTFKYDNVHKQTGSYSTIG